MVNSLQPSISINKLGEFIAGTDSKKRQILKTLKYPATFINGRYASPKSAAMHFMLDDQHDLSILHSKRQHISKKEVASEWQKNNQTCCLQAMDDLIFCSNTVLAPYLNFRSQKGLPKDKKTKVIDGVLVRMNPDVVLLDPSGDAIVGALSLVFSKSRPVSSIEGQVIAGLIRKHIEVEYNLTLKPGNCVAVDVFHRRSIIAESDFKFWDLKIKSACREIAEMWPKINQ